jgi:hypothetical protein
MHTDSRGTAGRTSRQYRITVREQVSQMFVDPLQCVVVESSGQESILHCEDVDQAKLQVVLRWLYSRGVEILSVMPDDGVRAVDALSSYSPHGNEPLPKGRHDG